ncbi:MAG: FAD-binding protein [Proteobacteria bacterium]|nr:FAD-binding protein [Pseudomonadota bacterium]
MKKDIIVIGAGLAGMVATYMAQKEGAEIVLIDRGSIGIGTNSAMSNGVFAGPTSHYSPDEYIRDTLKVGRMINSEPFVKLIAREAPEALNFLSSFGLDIVESNDLYALKSSRPDIIPGVTLVKKLAEVVKNLDRVHILTDFYVEEILKKENRVYGVRGFDKTGREMDIYAPAIVLATGGAGAIYLRNDNQKNTMGQGYYLAARAGLELWDMEFVQFYPLVISGPHLPSMLHYPPYPKEAKLINASGDDVVKKYGMDNINEAVIKKRDEFSAILFEEIKSGPVYMDYRNVPSSSWGKHPLSLLAKLRFDFRNKPVPTSPAVHFFMGGVRTDERGHTSLKGLFACGEVVWGLHGANRRGGNALTECVVFGRISGRSSAQYALANRLPSLDLERTPGDKASYPTPTGGQLREIRQKIREIAWNYAGMVKTGKGLEEGLDRLEEVEGQLRKTDFKGVMERKLKEDLVSASFILRAIFFTSLSRKESRGSFIRKDFPQEDNINWRKNSCLAYDPERNTFSVSHHDVIAPIFFPQA